MRSSVAVLYDQVYSIPSCDLTWRFLCSQRRAQLFAMENECEKWYFCFRIVFLLASLAWSTANWSYLYIEHARNTYDNSFATDWQASLRFMAGSENLAGFYMFIVQRIFLKGQPSLYLALLCRLSWFVSGHCFGISQGQVLVGTRVKSCIEQGYMRSVEVWWS